MSLIVITTCSDRKRFPLAPTLDGRRIVAETQEGFLGEWLKRVDRTAPAGPASSVYGGRSFQEAMSTAKAANGDFRIISGGLGLIRSSDEIPSYSLSLVPSSQDYVGSRIKNGSFNASDWWRGVQRSSCLTPLSSLIKRKKEALVLIGLSKVYFSLVADDLMRLSDDDLKRVRFAGMGLEAVLPDRLRSLVLPYDSRLDGPDSPLPGTRGDFASRAMRHFVESIFMVRGGLEHSLHSEAVRKALKGWRAAKVHEREPRTDAEIIRIIKKNWKAIEGKSGRGLRHLRDVENVACEQGRFAALFRRAAQEVQP